VLIGGDEAMKTFMDKLDFKLEEENPDCRKKLELLT